MVTSPVCMFASVCVQPSRQVSASQLMSLRPSGLPFQHILRQTHKLSCMNSLSHTHICIHPCHFITHWYSFVDLEESLWSRLFSKVPHWDLRLPLSATAAEEHYCPKNKRPLISVLDEYTLSTPPFILLSSPERWNHPHTENGRLDKMSRIT